MTVETFLSKCGVVIQIVFQYKGMVINGVVGSVPVEPEGINV